MTNKFVMKYCKEKCTCWESVEQNLYMYAYEDKFQKHSVCADKTQRLLFLIPFKKANNKITLQ